MHYHHVSDADACYELVVFWVFWPRFSSFGLIWVDLVLHVAEGIVKDLHVVAYFLHVAFSFGLISVHFCSVSTLVQFISFGLRALMCAYS